MEAAEQINLLAMNVFREGISKREWPDAGVKILTEMATFASAGVSEKNVERADRVGVKE
jgi:hypothetical protein